MPGSLYGKVCYDQNSCASIVYSKEEIATTGQFLEPTNMVSGVAVTLYNDTTKKGLTVKTRDDGSFQINEIPNGTYKLIETFGFTAQYEGTQAASFQNNAINMTTQPVPIDPTVEYIKSKGFVTNGATKIVSISRNIIPLTYTDTNSFYEIQFIDAPRILVPLQLRNYTTTGSNLIKSVSGGTFGTAQPGTEGGTSNSACPYTKYVSGNYASTNYDTEIYDYYIQYSNQTPNGGYFTICNIANKQTFSKKWFDTPSKMTGDETGRFLIINGNYPKKYFFKEKVTVKANTDYLFTAWIMNIYRIYSGALPVFKIVVTDSSETELYSNNVSADNPLNATKIPTWKQIGAIIPGSAIGTKTNLTIKFVSMGIEAAGNDYCVDDISLLELEPCDLKPTLKKTTLIPVALENQEISYVVTLTNGTAAYIYDMGFIDPLPYGTELYSNVMTIKVYSTTATIAEFTTTINESLLSSEPGVNISKLIGNEINVNQTNYISSPYFSDLREGRLSRNLLVDVKFSIKVPNASLLSDEKIIRNSAKYNYSSPMDSDNLVPRIVLSNEVITEIRYPIISYKKELSVYENGQERILENGEGVLCGQKVAYRIVITNSQKMIVPDVQITDYLDDESLIPIYSKPGNCANGISIEETSPIVKPERFLECSDIEQIDGSIYNIKISNITLPTAWVDHNNNDELKLGICIIRIYCEIKCDS